MKYHSRALAGTALGLFMAASAAGATNLHPVADGNSDSAVQPPLLMAQADSENPIEKKARKAERRAEKRAQQEEGGAQQEEPAARSEKPRRERQEGGQRQSDERAGKAERKAQQAPTNDEAPAMKPNRRDRQAETAARQAGQGGDNDDGQPTVQKRKQRQESESGKSATTRQAPESAGGKEADQGRKHRNREKNADRGENNGSRQATEGRNKKPEAAEVPKAEKQLQDSDSMNQKKAGEARDRKNGKNAKGEETTGKSRTETGEAAPKPESQPEQPPDNAGKANNKLQPEQADRDNRRDRDGDRRRSVEGQQPDSGEENAQDRNARGNRENARGQEADGSKGQAAEGGGNVVLPRSLNGERAGEGRKRERRNAREQNGNDDNAILPDSARGRHGQRREAGRGGKAEPLPDSDAAAQADFRRPERIESITALQGRRVDKPERVYREHPRDVKVVKEVDNRTIVEVNNQIFVRGSDRPRITRHARDVYYEDLPQQRTREVVVREDGSRVVTIRNEYGDVIRRSRIMPDNREIVLVYVDDRDLDRDRDYGWGDAGADLPPLVVDVPRDDYILEADDVQDPDRYYTFLEQPPVEPVRRLYSLGEVKRSARIRDIMPRIDLDTITFDFGSAEVGQDQADKLQSVADAIKRILDDNPAETFLIEGHTDAVGSDQANLVLSDERADSVASALTTMFEIPSENLTTQGYGEEFLKVDTEEANRQNRRVTIRRITPLVAPVASAE